MTLVLVRGVRRETRRIMNDLGEDLRLAQELYQLGIR